MHPDSLMVPDTPLRAQPRTMIKEKRLINSFLLANICDIAITAIALTLPGFVEKGLVAGELFEQARFVEPVIFKIAITAFMIGIYALAMHRRGRWSSPIATALKIGTVVVWMVVAWNELNVALALKQLF